MVRTINCTHKRRVKAASRKTQIQQTKHFAKEQLHVPTVCQRTNCANKHFYEQQLLQQLIIQIIHCENNNLHEPPVDRTISCTTKVFYEERIVQTNTCSSDTSYEQTFLRTDQLQSFMQTNKSTNNDLHEAIKVRN